MPKIVRAASAVQLLAMVPELVGFAPQDSLVLVVFAGSKTCAAYRVDLPGEAGDLAYKRFATTLIGMLCRIRGADGVIPIVYTNDAFEECGDVPHDSLATRFVSRARSGGFRVLDALCVARDGWSSYLSDRGKRHPLSELDDALAARRSASDTLPVIAAPHRQTRLPRSSASTRERTAEAYARLGRAGVADNAEPGGVAAVGLEQVADPVWFAGVSLNWDAARLTPVQAALIAFAVRSAAVRDIVMFSWAWGEDIGLQAAEFNARWNAGQGVDPDDDIALALGGMGGLRAPDPKRLDRAIELLRQVTTRLPSSLRAPTFTMLAWLSWAAGRGSVAWHYLDRARRIDAGYGLAELLGELLCRGALPEWLYSAHTGNAPLRVRG